MKNAPFYAILGVVAIVVGILAIALYLQAMSGSLPENAAGGICLITFLIAATIMYEMVAKPGLYMRRRKQEDGETESVEGDVQKKPESPEP